MVKEFDYAKNGGFPHFDRSFFGSKRGFTVIGRGEIGGKAAGLAFAKDLIERSFPQGECVGVEINIPKLAVVTTELFDAFMSQNDLYEVALSDATDERIAHAFQQTELPALYVGDLWALISEVSQPLAVRSSSLLEDAKHKPFAGIYSTKMIPNNQADVKVRFQLLTQAIKYVYASTFFRAAKDYMKAAGYSPEEEKMAVIIQEVIGVRRGERFYPNLSGVARSYNYYPFGHAKNEDGIVNLALGLGKTIVDGGISWNYTPEYPRSQPPFASASDLMKHTQTAFWAVNMGKPPAFDPVSEAEYLIQGDLSDAEYDGVLTHIASTYNRESDSMVMGVGRPGPRAITFAPILSAEVIPLNELIIKLMSFCEEELGTPVEIEFAMTFGAGKEKHRFGFLQVRPMVVYGDATEVSEEEMKGENALLASENVLGNGTVEGIKDIVFVKPDTFEAKNTPRIAQELAEINRKLLEEKRPYLLIGFGRWGSSDHWLGIPVSWGQISGAKAIVEATLDKMNVDLSQGSHFFHNINGFQVSYFSVAHHSQAIDWGWLNERRTETETGFVKHITLDKPLTIKVDGRTGKGVALK